MDQEIEHCKGVQYINHIPKNVPEVINTFFLSFQLPSPEQEWSPSLAFLLGSGVMILPENRSRIQSLLYLSFH